jgi:hypothetical protein
VKRALLLVLFGVVPLVMLLYPAFRRAMVRNLRLVLVIYAGLLLLGGTVTTMTRPAGPIELVAYGVGVALIAVAAAGVVRDIWRER